MEPLITKTKRAFIEGYSKVVQAAVAPLLYYEWRRRETRRVNERAAEYGFTLNCLQQAGSRTVLDVGSGRTAWPQLLAGCGLVVTAIDEMHQYWQGLFVNRHHWVVRDDITAPATAERFDAITCLSVIEHIPNDEVAMRGIASLLAPGGQALLSFPYSENRYVENVYALDGVSYGKDSPFICRMYSRENIDRWVRATGLVLREQKYFRVFTGDLWAFGERLCPVEEVDRESHHHLTCIQLVRPH